MPVEPLKLGQELWRVARYRYSDAGIVKVVKIGRRWATLDNDERIDKATLRLAEGNGGVWPSKDAYDRHLALETAWQAFRRLMDRQYRIPDGVGLNQIENAARALFGCSVKPEAP